jgi:small subunit ribosomal protein S4
LCRREGLKLFLKGERCYTDKCSFDRRPYPPGQHGQRRIKFTEYGIRLREKQKVKRLYGVAERQFRGYYFKASRMKGVTGENLLVLLERRLDNIVYRFGFASDHAEGRQLVRHGHFTINGKRVNIPSYLVRTGDVVAVAEKSQKIKRIGESLGAIDRRGVPQWLELEKDKFSGRVKGMPSREDFTMPIREQLIVELYSK